ncbi:hypothetical protein D1007_18894 [Hordeum vulgare]|nr:hypothetical protein D1007_18894 [Hordeum vulgare]
MVPPHHCPVLVASPPVDQIQGMRLRTRPPFAVPSCTTGLVLSLQLHIGRRTTPFSLPVAWARVAPTHDWTGQAVPSPTSFATSPRVQGIGIASSRWPLKEEGLVPKAMWHRRKVLPRQQEAGHPASSSSSKWRQIPPDLHALCFRYFEEGHRRPDCTNDPLFIRCGFSGHVSSQCTRPRNPISVEELRKAVIAKASKARPAPRLDHENERSLVGCAHLPSRAVFPPGDGGPVGGVHCTEVNMFG